MHGHIGPRSGLAGRRRRPRERAGEAFFDRQLSLDGKGGMRVSIPS